MKKFKFMAFLLFAAMLSVNLTSCSDDEPGSSQSITEKLQGEWFLVNMEYNYSDGASYHIIWDYNNQTADGYCKEDNDSYPAEKLVISYAEVSGFRIEERSYENGSWVNDGAYYVSLEDVTNGTFINEDDFTTNIKLSGDVLEITETETDYDGESVYKYTYRRIKTANEENEKQDVNASAKKKFTAAGVSFKMVKVKGGTFKMGSNDSEARDNEKPVHGVTLSDYYIGETEVTQGLWEAVMMYSGKCADGTTMSAYGSGVWLGDNPSSTYGLGTNYPVYTVNYNDINDIFLHRLNRITGKKFRLPTEAEWEYAARGGNKSQGYKYSGGNTIGDVAWYYENSYDLGSSSHDYGTHPVGTKTPNELGLYDMSGNVWEWCSDWYSSYTSSSPTNPTGPTSGSDRVLRGGSWNSYAQGCRVSFRQNRRPGDLYGNNFGYGFRLALRP